MNEKEQRIAIAEACGAVWVKVPPQPEGGYISEYHPNRLMTFNPDDLRILPLADPKTKDSIIVPDYPNDLNAMHEAEQVLGDGRNTWDKYCDLLGGSLYHCAHATASQRAQAFLKTLNLWRD